MKRLPWEFVLLPVALLWVSCAPHSQDLSTCVLVGEPSGFWLGLWHGIIAPITFIISLFEPTISVFDINNNGNWYIFGFLLGIGAFSSGGIFGSRRARRRT